MQISPNDRLPISNINSIRTFDKNCKLLYQCYRFKTRNRNFFAVHNNNGNGSIKINTFYTNNDFNAYTQWIFALTTACPFNFEFSDSSENQKCKQKYSSTLWFISNVKRIQKLNVRNETDLQMISILRKSIKPNLLILKRLFITWNFRPIIIKHKTDYKYVRFKSTKFGLNCVTFLSTGCVR